jgi:hypothetical protein
MTTEATGALQIKGTVYINAKINGAFQGLKDVPGVVEFSVTPKSKTITQISKDRATAGQVTGVASTPEPAEVKIKFSAFNSKMMAIAMMGESSVLSSGAGTVTNEIVTAKLDTFARLSKRNMTAGSVVVTDAATDLVTYVEGTDYTVNYAVGMIKPLSTGSIVNAASLHVDFANAAYEGFETVAATMTDVVGYFLIDGVNNADGENVEIEIDEAHLTPSSPVDFMTDKFSELELSGFMVTQPDKNNPYRIRKWQSA